MKRKELLQYIGIYLGIGIIGGVILLFCKSPRTIGFATGLIIGIMSNRHYE